MALSLLTVRGGLRGHFARGAALAMTMLLAGALSAGAIGAESGASPLPTDVGDASSSPKAACTDDDIVGFGRGTTGGSGGTTVEVSAPWQLFRAIESSRRPLHIRITADSSDVWNISQVKIERGDLTIEGDPDILFEGTQFLVRASNVILRHLYVGTGDEDMTPGDAADWDPFTVNGLRYPVSNIVVQCVVGIWGPDIGGLAILGETSDITVQDSILGEGLYLSKHPEATTARDGHSHALNVARLEPGLMDERITVARNLIVRSEGRMPKVTGGREIEVVNNLIIGWGSRAPEGNAESLHVVGNYLIPSSMSTELLVWSPRAQDTDLRFHRDSVWVAGNVLEGVGGDELRGPPRRVYRSEPAFEPSHQAMDAGEARDHALEVAGGLDRPAWAQRVVDDAVSGVDVWFNGKGHPAPNPMWEVASDQQ